MKGGCTPRVACRADKLPALIGTCLLLLMLPLSELDRDRLGGVSDFLLLLLVLLLLLLLLAWKHKGDNNAVEHVVVRNYRHMHV